ncbi:DUF1217 domain-containing protein [Rubrimonas cliftonensis]|uniref:Flagellar protein n=1 Tax=Rubrimonas cliftonensis TaxID=89524 RepID=A0A1H4G8D1_9RHOB|nr:DUF1217 domain-containing protein [Rubrimonas cliftonensis]SEB05270.1 Protein of unknown function [Rubrimonas cliftonensis]
MTYQPVIPSAGVAGWRFLQRTETAQRAAFAESAIVKREIAYFESKIGAADTPEKLVADPTLLKVALGAFGMGDEAYKKALLRKVLDEGTETDGAMALRFSDQRFREFAGAFGYGDAKGAQVTDAAFVKDIVARYKVRSFEEAVGAVDNTMRLVMNFERSVSDVAGSASRDRTKWARILGDVPLRRVIEGALALPTQFAQLDLDVQIETLESKFARVFGGDVSKLTEADTRDAVIRRYLAIEQTKQGPSAFTPGAAALTLLQGGGFGPGASTGLFLSRL